MTGQQSKGLRDSYRFFCRGVEKNGKHAFAKKEAELVVVKVYRNGETTPLCRYVEPVCVTPRCNPELRNGICNEFSEDDLGVCHYATRS